MRRRIENHREGRLGVPDARDEFGAIGPAGGLVIVLLFTVFVWGTLAWVFLL